MARKFFDLSLLFLILTIYCCEGKKSDGCESSPFLYITVHDEVKNVIKYSRDGCLLSNGILSDSHFHLDSELRSMIIGKYKGEDALYVADASSHESRILLFTLCNDKRSWCFHSSVVSSRNNPGANHGYGLCFDDRGNLYASFQHTNTVLGFKKDTFEPIDINPVYANNRKSIDYFDGTFIQFGEPIEHDKIHRGVRSIVYVNGNIWIAHEDLEGIIVVSVETGKIVTIISVTAPIGLHLDPETNIVYVGCKSDRFGGAVYGIDISTFTLLPKKNYRSSHMKHPTGITSYKNILYVGEQSQNAIHMFDIKTCEHIGKLVSDLPGKVEQLTVCDI
jgi:hypothetical protein